MILSWLLHFFAGYDAIACPPVENGTARLHGEVMQTLADIGVQPWRVSHKADGTLVLLLPRRDTARLCDLPIAEALSLRGRYGLPALLVRYRRRIGIPLGVMLFCMMLFYFSQILWRVEVTGAVHVPAERIEAELASLGFDAGAWLSGADLYAASDRLLALDADLAYVSVVRHGTVLRVRVRERELPTPPAEQRPTNLVAKKDGVVVSYTVGEGQPMVGAGQAVRAGELLVSGVVLHRGGSLSVVCAQGAVYARTSCTATVEVPLSQVVQVEKGRVALGHGMKIFGWSINFSKNTGNEDIECDTITENRQIAFRERVRLPIWLTTVWQPLCQTETRTYSSAQAVRLATAQAQAQVRAELGAAQVLATSTLVEQTEDGYRVTYTVECIMDITAPREIGVLHE